MKIRSKILLAILVTLSPLLLFSLAVTRNNLNLSQRLTDLEQVTARMERVNHLQVSVADLPSAPNDFLSTGEAAERERFDRAISQVQTDILALSMIHQTGEEAYLLADTSSQVDAITALGNEIFTLSEPVGNPEGIALMRQMDALATDLVSGSLAQPHSLAVAEMAAANTIFKQEMARTNQRLLFGVPAILLFSLVLGLLFARNLTAPLRELQAGAEQIAGGQFDSRLNIRTGDELEALAANFNRMAGRLSELYAGLEQQVAERTAELAISEARYRGLAQTAADAIITIDTDGRIRFFNRAAERIFGYPADEALNQDVGILIPPEYVGAHQAGIQRYLETGEPHIIGHTVEFKGRRKDGEIFPLEMSLSEVRTETDLSFTGIIRDITRRNLAEAEIYRRNRDMTLLNRVISAASVTLEPMKILETICRELVTAFNVTHAAAALPDEKGESLRIVAEAGQEGQPSALGITIPISGSPPMQSLWAKQETVVMDDSSPYLQEVWGEKWWAVMTGSLLVAPLLIGDQALGAVALANEKKRPFSADEIALVEHVAAAAAQVLANARLLAGERRRRTELETLHQAGLALASSLDTTAVLEAVLSHTISLAGAMDAYIFFYRNRQLTFAAKKWADGYQEPPTPLTFKPGGLTETVAVTGQRVVIPDIPGDPEYARLYGGAYIGLPLRTGEQVLGVMNIAFEQPRAFTEDELRLLELLAAQAAAALDNARLFAEANDALSREKQLTEIARTINSALDLPVVLETIVRQAVELVGADAGAMALKDPGGETISYPYIFNLPASLSSHLARRGRGLAWRVVETGDSFLFADYSSQPDAQPQWVAAGIQAIMAVPVVAGEKRIAALGLFGLTPEKHFSQRDILLAETVGRQAGIAIQNARLFETEQAYAAELETRVAERTAELSAANAELARAARAKDEFLANMSHELRTPLSSILLRSELLQRQVYGDLTDRQVDSLQIIDAAGEHLLSLINDILDVAKIEAGKVELDIQIISVKAVCQASLQMVKEMAQKKSIELCNEIGSTAVSLQADNRRLKQILVNLLSNAVKFTPEGGRVGLEVTGDAEQEIIWFTVWDTGIGIAARGMERLFQPFEQLDSSLSRQFEGTGLGLTLVRRLAELHLGSVSVTSEAGAGSRFTVALPWKSGADREEGVAEIESGKTAVSRAAPVVDEPVETILLADDNEILVIGMEDFLTQAGYRVEVACNGAEAVACASEEAPDLILMDTHMPVLDGLEAIRRIRATEDLADVPIVSLTALAMPGDRERCLEAGATAYLSKPIRLDELKELIERLLRIEN